MITSIHGTIETLGTDYVVIRVGGFGIRVSVPTSTLSGLREPNMKVSLYTHFHMREDGIALYGFSAEADRDAFEQLIGINGVGPKVALAILSVMDAATLYQAIAEEDQQRLGLARGVGKKLVGQIILALKGKLPSLAGVVPAGTAAAGGQGRAAVPMEVMEALIGLGYSTTEAQGAIAKIPQDQAMTLEQQVAYALRTFSRQ